MNRKTLIKFLKCETSDREELAVLDWLDRDPKNQQRLDQLDMVFNAIILHNEPRVESPPTIGIIRNMNIIRYAFGVAASLILVLGAGWILSVQKTSQLSENLTAIHVPAGNQISVTLQDGSKVWLNAETTLIYPSVFADDTRRVKIDGEAIFEVEYDEDKPFIVETFAYNVEVLGTKFNVIANEDSQHFTTSLIEGSVRVVNRLIDNDYIILKPNQFATMVGEHLLLDNMENKDDFLWVNGIISLKATSFEALMAKLEKTYDVNIHLQRADTPKISYRGKVRISEGIEHALNILSFGGEFKYERRINSNDIYIK